MSVWTPKALAASASAKFTHPFPVRFQDVDAAGVFFFARLFDAFHDAYFAYLTAHGYDIARLLAAAEVLLPLSHCEADYLRPLRYGDRAQVELVAARVTEDELTLGYRVRREADSAPCATGESVHVGVEAGTFRRTRLPSEYRALFSGWVDPAGER